MKIWHPLRLLFLSICLTVTPSTTSAQNIVMMQSETFQKIDSLCKAYFIHYRLNTDYLRRHPVKRSEWKRLENHITSASPVRNGIPIKDSLGCFEGIKDVGPNRLSRINEMKDSIRNCSVWNSGVLNGVFSLDADHDLSYFLCFDRLDSSDSITIRTQEIGIVNKNTNDTTWVEPKNHRFAKLSNPPLIYASVFDVEWNGHLYAVHEIFDIRTVFNRRNEVFQYTRSCYQIR